MAERSWTLTNWTDRTYVEDLMVTPEDVGGPAKGYSIRKHRLRGGASDGVDVVHIDNGALRFVVLPTRGMGLWKGWTGGDALGWNSPIRGPVHPSLVPLTDASGLGWLDGFDEWLVRCGLESNGAPEFTDQGQVQYGLHGRIANKPAHEVTLRVDGQAGTITLSGVVDEMRFHFFKLRMFTTVTTRIGQAGLEIRDTIQNMSGSPTEFQMLYHINFGPPLLEPGAQVVTPVKTLVPRNARAADGVSDWSHYDAPVAGSEEQVYFSQLHGDAEGRSAVLLKNAAGTRGASVHFDTRQLPCFTLWKNTTAEADGFVTGLEPGTNFPNPRSFEKEQGRIVTLEPGGTRSFDLRLEAHQETSEVDAVEQRIKALQGGAPTIHTSPLPDWCAGS